MTNLNLDAFYSVIRQHNAEETAVSGIKVDSLSTTPDHCTAEDLEEAARYLITALERDPGDWLSLDVYRNDDGEFKAEVSITLGGPTVRLEYESLYRYLRFEYSTGYTSISADISTDDYTAGADFAETISNYSEC